MLFTERTVEQMLKVLDEVRKELAKERKPKYPYGEWERKRKLVRERLRKLPEYVEVAAGKIQTDQPPGRKKRLNLAQRVMLFLFARLMNKSNRDVEQLLELFSPLFGFRVSYKTVERLYSDEEVKLALHNLLVLLLRDEGLSGELAGDGTGYSLTITRHYASNPKRRGRDYRYVFRIVDLATGMYVGVGYSKRSEAEAFTRAAEMLRGLGVPVNSISLDPISVRARCSGCSASALLCM
jgi:transposase